MAQGSQTLTTYYAKRIIGDNAATTSETALLQAGAGVTNDTWIFGKTGRSSAYGIKYVYDYDSTRDVPEGTADKIAFIGDGYYVVSTWLDTGDTYIKGKLGVGYDPTTSGNDHKLYVTGSTYVSTTLYTGQNVAAGDTSVNDSDRMITVRTNSGEVALYSSGNTNGNGNRGLWFPAHGTASSGIYAIQCSSDNNIILKLRDSTLGTVTTIQGASTSPSGVTASSRTWTIPMTSGDRVFMGTSTSGYPYTQNGIFYAGGTTYVAQKASANGALYATEANGSLSWGTLPIAQGGTSATTALEAITNLGGPYLKSTGTEITASSNLDSGYKAMGTYYSSSSSRSETLSGTVPITSSGFKMITAIGYRAATIRQFLGGANNNLYYRSSQDTGETWTKWYKFMLLPSGSDNKTFAAIGSATKPIYVDSTGVVAACTGFTHTPTAGVTWVKGRDSAPFVIDAYSNYNAITSQKTTNGSWQMGVYTDNEMWFTYTSDANYNSNTNYYTKYGLKPYQTDTNYSKYISDSIYTISRSNLTYTATRLDGTTFTFDMKDIGWADLADNANSLSAGNSNATSGTELLVSYASDNGFADTNAPGKVYRRAASKIVNGTLVKAALGTVSTTAKKFLKDTGSWVQVDWGDLTGKPSSFTPSSHDHDSVYVKIDGTTAMTGDLCLTKARTNQTRIYVTNTGYNNSNELQCSLMIGSQGTYHGIYSNGYASGSAFTSDAKWLIYRNTSGTVIVNGNCTGSAGSATNDSDGNAINTYYCTLSTDQTLSGAKTITGNFTAKGTCLVQNSSTSPGIQLRGSDLGSTNARIYALSSETSDKKYGQVQIAFRETSPAADGTLTSYYEQYRLPAVNIGRTSNATSYYIYTTKNVSGTGNVSCNNDSGTITISMDESGLVHLTGAETISGDKTFSGDNSFTGTSGANATNAQLYAKSSTTTAKITLYAHSNGNHGLYSNGYWNGTSFVSSAQWLLSRNTSNYANIPLITQVKAQLRVTSASASEGGEIYLAPGTSDTYDATLDNWYTTNDDTSTTISGGTAVNTYFRISSSSTVRFRVNLRNGRHSDYAENRPADSCEYGRVYKEQDCFVLTKADARMIPGCSICSDTYRMCINDSSEGSPFAVAGCALVYPYQERTNYHAGMAVCSAPNGTVDIMTREEIMMYPDCIIGYVAGIPSEEDSVPQQYDIDGRIWIKIR